MMISSPMFNPSTPAAYLCDAGAGERHDHGHHVDGQLELQELGDAVVDVPAPHDGLHDAVEVVVGQDDVGRLLGHVGAGDSLKRRRRLTLTSLAAVNLRAWMLV